ncbi:MAG: hypothetical protein ACRC35_01755 [Angustibacter sp.]
MHLDTGATIVLLETSRGLVLVTREQLAHMVQEDLDGHDLVGALLAERRAAAAQGD